MGFSKVITNPQFHMVMYEDSFNQRIRVDDIRGDGKYALLEAEKEVRKLQYDKLIVYIKREMLQECIERGYQLEGIIDHYFLGSNAYICTKYFSNERRLTRYWMEEDDILSGVYEKEYGKLNDLPEGYEVRDANERDGEELAKLFQKIFKVYPTPIHDANYIKLQIQKGTIFSVVTFQNEIVSCASAEINEFYKNAEITDCLTIPEMRKLGLLKHIILRLEKKLLERSIYCSYSLARSLSFGMNASLYQLGYQYRGRLMNNCYIYDKLENMNVWVKKLTGAEKFASRRKIRHF